MMYSAIMESLFESLGVRDKALSGRKFRSRVVTRVGLPCIRWGYNAARSPVLYVPKA